MRKPLLAMLIVLVFVGGLLYWWILGAPFTISLTREELQRYAATRFPITKNEVLFKASLEDPEVLLDSKTDLIGLAVTLKASAVGVKTPLEGRAQIEGVPRYEPLERELYLDSGRLKLHSVTGLTPEDVQMAEQVIIPLLRPLLSRVPIYRFREADVRRIPGNVRLHDIQVADGRLLVTLGR